LFCALGVVEEEVKENTMNEVANAGLAGEKTLQPEICKEKNTLDSDIFCPIPHVVATTQK
jgi:hypothetical protein